MRTKVFPVVLAASLAILTLACDPSAEDETNMDKKMELEEARSKLLTAVAQDKDCAKFETDLGEWVVTNKETLATVDQWWGGVGDGVKEKLIAKHQTEWDQQTTAMGLGVMTCPAEFDRGMAKLK